MTKNKRKVTIPEMFTLMEKFKGRQIEVDLSPIDSANTYHWFSVKEINDVIQFIDLDNDHPQMLTIVKTDILSILYSEGENLFRNTFTINLKYDQQIKICVYEEQIFCYKCLKVLNNDKDMHIWTVDGAGGYSSHFDSERLSLKVCDDCMYEFVYGCEFVDLEGCCDSDIDLNKEKTCH